MKGIELNNLPQADETDQKQGWTIEPILLEEIQDIVTENYPGGLTLEEIEIVLVAASRVDMKRRMEHNEKAVG